MLDTQVFLAISNSSGTLLHTFGINFHRFGNKNLADQQVLPLQIHNNHCNLFYRTAHKRLFSLAGHLSGFFNSSIFSVFNHLLLLYDLRNHKAGSKHHAPAAVRNHKHRNFRLQPGPQVHFFQQDCKKPSIYDRCPSGRA